MPRVTRVTPTRTPHGNVPRPLRRQAHTHLTQKLKEACRPAVAAHLQARLVVIVAAAAPPRPAHGGAVHSCAVHRVELGRALHLRFDVVEAPGRTRSGAASQTGSQ